MRLILPVAVTRKRFFAALLVFLPCIGQNRVFRHSVKPNGHFGRGFYGIARLPIAADIEPLAAQIACKGPGAAVNGEDLHGFSETDAFPG